MSWSENVRPDPRLVREIQIAKPFTCRVYPCGAKVRADNGVLTFEQVLSVELDKGCHVFLFVLLGQQYEREVNFSALQQPVGSASIPKRRHKSEGRLKR